MAKQDNWLKVTVRIPPELHLQLVDATGPNSLNAEIVHRLQQSFEYARIISAHEEAERRLAEREGELKQMERHVEILKKEVEDVKEGRNIELGNEAVQQAMIQHLHQVMGSVVEDMREEQRAMSGLPLLLDWFEQNPEAKRDYDALRPMDQEQFASEKIHELWLNHLNEKREAVGKRGTAETAARQQRVRLDK